MRVNVLVLDAAFDLGLSAVLDTFQTANELIEMEGLDVSHFDVRSTGVRKSVRTARGMRVALQPEHPEGPDCVIVPAIGYKMPEALEAALARRDIADAGLQLRRWAGHAGLMTAACIGTFVLAESGLLDQKRATTTWWLGPLFRRRYPTVDLDESRMIVASGGVATAGAALSHMDLALWIIRTVSPELAALTARYLIVDTRSAQSMYALSDHLAHSDALVRGFETWARERLSQPFSLDEAARAVNTSKRTLARRTQTVLGKSPLAFFQTLRVERAVHLLKTTNDSVERVATRVGYANASTLRTLLRRHLDTGTKELRGRGAVGPWATR